MRRSRELAQRERWPRERLERFQRERYEALVRHARAHSAFYRGWDGEPLDKATMMERFDDIVVDPRLRRDALLAHLEGIDGDELYLGRYRVMTTSGDEQRAADGGDRGAHRGGLRRAPAQPLRDDGGPVGRGLRRACRHPPVRGHDAGGERGRARPPGCGRAARLLVTNLCNYTLPLLRLEVADGVTITREPCPCGRTLRRLASITGRSDDVLSLGGVAVHPLHFGIVARDREVIEFQVVQTGPAAVRVLVVARADVEERLRTALGAQLRELGVPEPVVEIERRPALPRPESGKLQLVVGRAGVAASASAR